MPFELKFEKQLPVGFFMESIKGPGRVLVCVSEFVSSEDGDLLVTRLEGLFGMILPAITPHAVVDAANVNHFLAPVRPEGLEGVGRTYTLEVGH